jgi:hypothetical protein
MSKGRKRLEKRENPPSARGRWRADDLGSSSVSKLTCTPEWADLGPLKQLIPQDLRVVPGISQVFENGILSAYVSRLAQSK